MSESTNTEVQSTKVSSPSEECELCPHHWRVSLESVDEKIRGEFDSCQQWERRRRYDCTTFNDAGSSEKVTKSRSKYRSCRYTEADEQLRMLRMQMVCLLIGVFSIRMVKRQKVTSASLFDQGRNRGNQYGNNNTVTSSSTNGGGETSHRGVKYSQVLREDSMETIELTRNGVGLGGYGRGKAPKSPAPDLQTV